MRERVIAWIGRIVPNLNVFHWPAAALQITVLLSHPFQSSSSTHPFQPHQTFLQQEGPCVVPVQHPAFPSYWYRYKGWGERRNDGAISCTSRLATDPQSPDSLWLGFLVGADQVLGSFSWVGGQEVPPLLCVTELVPSKAWSHPQVNPGLVLAHSQPRSETLGVFLSFAPGPHSWLQHEASRITSVRRDQDPWRSYTKR